MSKKAQNIFLKQYVRRQTKVTSIDEPGVVTVRLSAEDRRTLTRLEMVMGCSKSEVIRQLLHDKDSSPFAVDPAVASVQDLKEYLDDRLDQLLAMSAAAMAVQVSSYGESFGPDLSSDQSAWLLEYAVKRIPAMIKSVPQSALNGPDKGKGKGGTDG